MDRVLNAFLFIIILAVLFNVMQIADALVLIIGGWLFFDKLEMIEAPF